MKIQWFCLWLAVTALMGVGSPGISLAESKDDGWISLFNGKDLSGWYTFLDRDGKNSDPQQVFTVEDGVIHIYKHAEDGASVAVGYFCTETEYSHYHLRFQYKWGEKRFGARAQQKRDAGVMYHCVGPDGVLDKTWPRCLECQVQEEDTGDTLCIAGTRCRTSIDPNARDLPAHLDGQYLTTEDGGVALTTDHWIARSHQRDELKRWNTVDLIVAGSDYAVHIVNGRPNNRLMQIEQQEDDDDDQWVPLAGGRILFQAELAEVFYRNIQIRPLGTGPFRQRGVPLTAAADGTFELHARDASLSGRSLRYQPDEHGTIGHWHYPEDKATWTINVPRAGKYDVEFDWAIDDRAAINTMQVVASGSSFQAKVPGTGGWSTYRKQVFGQLDLEAGVQDFTLEPYGELKGALMDIRIARLIPVE